MDIRRYWVDKVLISNKRVLMLNAQGKWFDVMTGEIYSQSQMLALNDKFKLQSATLEGERIIVTGLRVELLVTNNYGNVRSWLKEDEILLVTGPKSEACAPASAAGDYYYQSPGTKIW
jgi:hypothetical protein